ncbi:MAG TPA: hypothetical protein VEQ63_04035 [Bryobacteraceae bacterium]|nr:hypothetical protein [Bryobacteraceae bacterium]
MKTHPSDAQLALYAGRELNWLNRRRVGRHVSGCEFCAREVEQYRSAAEHLNSALNRMPAGLNWDRLSAEMTANINLGVEAGEIVSSVRRPRESALGWRATFVMAAMTCLLLVGWWLNPPVRRQPGMSVPAKAEMRTTAAGIELNANGNSLTLHTRGRQKPIIVSAPGVMRARFVDDSGQVTINNVHTD